MMRENDLLAATLKSIQLGTPTTYGAEGAADPHDLPWTTSFFKIPVTGPVFAGAMNLRGDRQSDLQHHGGADKAVLAYSAEHYPKWREELQMPEMPYGACGENLAISGLNEELVCIGDIFRIGAATFEASQPRQPCWKLGRRWRMHELPAQVVRNGRSGWYFRVLEEGFIEAGMSVDLVERLNPDWTIARANKVMYEHNNDLELTRKLAAVPRLSASWVRELTERAERLRGIQTLAGII
jgi:MOSC domain-containing protein YiiM